jgi:hypothetical protein
MKKTYKIRVSNCCGARLLTDDFDCDICSKCGEHSEVEEVTFEIEEKD